MAKRGKKISPLFLVLTVLMGVVFLPTTILLFVGMMPTIAAFFIDRSKHKTRVLSIGAMNLSGTSPFIMELWLTEHSINTAMNLAVDARSIIVMFCAASVGYLIDWAMTGIMNTIMVEKAKLKIEQNVKAQKKLVERWGPEVTGDIPLDEYGFPINASGPSVQDDVDELLSKGDED